MIFSTNTTRKWTKHFLQFPLTFDSLCAISPNLHVLSTQHLRHLCYSHIWTDWLKHTAFIIHNNYITIQFNMKSKGWIITVGHAWQGDATWRERREYGISIREKQLKLLKYMKSSLWSNKCKQDLSSVMHACTSKNMHVAQKDLLNIFPNLWIEDSEFYLAFAHRVWKVGAYFYSFRKIKVSKYCWKTIH